MALTSEVLVRLKAAQTGSNDFGADRFAPEMQALLQLSSGTGAGQADILFMDERTVGASTNDDVDLAGALSDAFGATITAAEVVAVFIINAPRSGTANVSDLTIGNAAAPFEGFLSSAGTIGPIKPGGVFLLAAGDAAGIGTVTATSADILRIANGSGGSATYQIGVLARSA